MNYHYPVRPVRLIVPYTPGGVGDTMARTIAQHLTGTLGQPVIVDNRPGASESIGAEVVARSAPDGHTLFIATETALVFNTILKQKLPYDPVHDLAPIALLCRVPFYLVVNPSVPAQSVQDLIALAKSQPGKLTFASIGSGSMHHLVAEIFKSNAGLDIVHVPYKGSGPAMTDIVSGQVHLMFQGGGSALPYVRSGKLRGLASTTAARTEATPNMPTMMESGVPDFDVASWFGLFTAAGTPKSVIERLNLDVSDLLRSQQTRQKFALFGVDITPGSAEELAERIRKDIPFWKQFIRQVGIKPS